jgi:hypothetical protein
MEKNSTDNILVPLRRVLTLLETVIKARKLDREHHKDEMEKHFAYLCQNNDLLEVYERRAAGVKDEEWTQAVEDFRKMMKNGNGKGEEHEADDV